MMADAALEAVLPSLTAGSQQIDRGAFLGSPLIRGIDSLTIYHVLFAPAMTAAEMVLAAIAFHSKTSKSSSRTYRLQLFLKYTTATFGA